MGQGPSDVHTERGWRDGIGAWLHLYRRAA